MNGSQECTPESLHTYQSSTVTTCNNNYRRPYLTLKERWSQVWLNYYTIICILIVVKLVLFKMSLDASLSQAKAETFIACKNAESYASSMTSLPHYLSKGANVLIAQSLTEANRAFIKTLQMIITGSQNLVIFTLELTLGTYVCILTAAVDGVAEAALNATESVINVANETIVSLADEIQNGLDDVAGVINTVIDAWEDVEDFFKGDDDSDKVHNGIDKVNLTVSSLKKWKISGSINTKLENLSKGLPDFDDVKNHTETLIKEPFTLLKEHVGTHLDNEFDADELLVPQKRTLTFCHSSSEIDDFYNDIGKLLRKGSTIMIVLLVVVAVALVFYEMYMTKRQWNRINDTANQLQRIPDSKSGYEHEMTVEIIETVRNRYGEMINSLIGRLIGGSNEVRVNNSRWVVNYVISDAGLAILLLGLAGILTFVLQLVLLLLISGAKTDGLEEGFKTVGKQISASMNDSMNEWANDTNLYLEDQETSINDSVLGWVYNSTETINNTISEFVDLLDKKLDDVFGSTPLYGPVSTIVGCALTSKLEKVEEALTWIHNHSQVSLPRINASEYMNSLTDSSSDGKSTDLSKYIDDTKEVLVTTRDTIVKKYRKGLNIELYISIAFIALWLVLLAIAMIILYFKEQNIKKREKETYSIEELKSMVSLPLPPAPSYTREFENFDYQDVIANPPNLEEPGNQEQFYRSKDSLHPFSGSGAVNQTLLQMMNKLRATPQKTYSRSFDTYSSVYTESVRRGATNSDWYSIESYNKSLQPNLTAHDNSTLIEDPFDENSYDNSFKDSTLDTAIRWPA